MYVLHTATDTQSMDLTLCRQLQDQLYTTSTASGDYTDLYGLHKFEQVPQALMFIMVIPTSNREMPYTYTDILVIYMKLTTRSAQSGEVGSGHE